MYVTVKIKRGPITLFLMLIVSLFIFFHHYFANHLVTNFTTLPVQWNVSQNPGLSAKPRGEITCNRSHRSYDLCSITGPTLLDPRSSILYGLGVDNGNMTSLKIKPYPRKADKTAMSNVREVTLTSSAPPKAGCDVTHRSPALLFSAGGYTGNFFHDFNDGLIPLFVTVNSLFGADRDIVLAVADRGDWWARKYAEPLSRISNHPIVDLSRDRSTHCFPWAVVGLITHGVMKIDPKLLRRPKTILDFRAFLKDSYSPSHNIIGKRKNVRPRRDGGVGLPRPRMVVVSRGTRDGRVIVNIEQVLEMAEKIGFDVAVLEPWKSNLGRSFRLIEASHAMLGVHGAGLTHELFLRPEAVLFQVVPIATNWVARSCYEAPARALGLEYLEYKIEPRESSLFELYGNYSLVIRDPDSVVNGNWTNMRLYLKTQNVKLDLVRFEGYLRKAYEKAKRFMDVQG